MVIQLTCQYTVEQQEARSSISQQRRIAQNLQVDGKHIHHLANCGLTTVLTTIDFSAIRVSVKNVLTSNSNASLAYMIA